jgi:hypothetical protein
MFSIVPPYRRAQVRKFQKFSCGAAQDTPDISLNAFLGLFTNSPRTRQLPLHSLGMTGYQSQRHRGIGAAQNSSRERI